MTSKRLISHRMYQRSKLPVLGKPAIPKGSAQHERASKPTFSNLAESSVPEVSWNKNRLNLDWRQSADFGFIFHVIN